MTRLQTQTSTSFLRCIQDLILFLVCHKTHKDKSYYICISIKKSFFLKLLLLSLIFKMTLKIILNYLRIDLNFNLITKSNSYEKKLINKKNSIFVWLLFSYLQ
jgi:hypothetical protein